MNKKGRPPFKPGNVRDQCFKVYATGSQLEQLTEAAREQGQSLSTFALNCALHVADKLSDRNLLKKKQDMILSSFKVKPRRPDGYATQQEGMEDQAG
tara:strand:- start:176 stop:466 length:291 start_codon:yes stop_codon:yes gene_type:complete